MKKLSRLLLVLTLVLLIGCTSVLLVACDDDTDQGPAPTTPSFRVSFMKNYPESGEEDVAFTNVTVRQGRTVSAYEITEDDRPAGYDFVGWFVEKDGDEKFDFATKITQNVKIYAHWTENGKSTEADLKGGVFTQEKVKIKTKEGEKEVDNGVWRYVTGANNEIAHEESRFDFGTDVLRKLKAASPKTTYSVWKDEECSLTINNDATNLVVNLKNGDNVYYIKAVAEDSKVTAVYKINVYLEPKYDVSVIRIQGNYESAITISAVAKGQKATAPSIATYVGHTFDGWYYYSEEKRNDKGQIVDADEDSGNILVKVGDKYYLADENGNRRFAYEDANGRKVVLYNGKYYLTDKSGARTSEEATEIYNRLDENGLPVYDEGKPIKVGSKTEYKWDFDINVIDREDITVFGKWTTNTYSITLKISEADKAKGAKFAKTNETELFIGSVNFGATAKAIEQLVNNKIGETTDSSRPVEKPFATFAGWYYTDESGNEIKVVDENGNGVHAFDFAKDIDLVAKFNAVTYKLVVNANDDSMMQEVTGSNDAWPYDQKATFTANPKDGYTLVRWLLNGEEYAPFGANKSVEYNIDEKHAINKTITFTAVFAPKDINVTLVDTVDNYGKTIVVKYNSDVALGQDAIPDVPKLSNDGTKRFIGWYYLDSEGTKTYVVKYNVNKNEILVGKWAFTEDVTLTAEWQPYEFNITIYEAEYTLLPDMGGLDITAGSTGWGEWDSAFLEQAGYILKGYTKAFSNGSTVSITATVNTPNHYMFVGWKQLDADGNLKDVPTDANLSVTVHEKDVTYVAFWSYKPVTVTFESGDPSVTAPEKTEVPFGKELELALPQGAPDEKTFDGWWNGDFQYTGADGKSFENRTFKDVMLIENGITLTAKWKNINYFFIEDGVIKGIDAEKAKKGDTYKDTFTIDFDDDVFEIADGAFKNNKFIKNITIKGNIKRIGKEAFANSNITSVTFEGNFKGLVIDEGAFRDCVGIKEIMLPDNVEELEANIFEGCYSLEKLAYSANVPLGVLFTTSNPNNNTYWYSAQQDGVVYYLPTALKEVIVTNTATAIADYAFQNATQLTKVTLATAIGDKPYTTEIGNNAFANDARPQTVIAVDLSAVERIGNSAFMNSSISTVDFSSLKELGNEAFFGSNVIKVVFFKNSGIDKISSDAFAKSELKEVQLDGIKSIGARAFSYSKLTSVSNADAVRSIGSKAFFNVTGITSAEIVGFANVTDIGREAFHGTGFFNTATDIVVKIGKVLYYDNGATLSPDATIVAIAPGAFKDTQNTIIDLSGFTSLTTIGADAFNGNVKIQTVILPDSLERIEARAFKESSVTSVDFSRCTKLEYIAPEAFANCIQLATLIFNDFADGIKKDTNTLKIQEKAFSGCTALVNVTLPKNLSELGSSVFESCANLVSVTFITNEQLNEKVEGSADLKYETDNLVKIIGDNAFMDCKKLTTVTLPYIITSIGKAAFKNCVELTAFTTMEGAKDTRLASIGSEAFFGCVKLMNVDNKTTEKVNNVGKSAFENCVALVNIDLSSLGIFSDSVFKNAINLESVKMPLSISVGKSAFENCGKLVNVTATINRADANAFINCVNIRSIVFASNIKEIGAHAFDGCVLIQKVVIPGSVVTIGDSAFNGCRNIITLTFEGNSLLSIGNSAFKDCELLTNVKLPASLTVLSASAFYGCSDLKNVEIGENIENIGVNAFAYCNDEIIVKFIGTTVPEFGGDIFGGMNNAKISVRQGYRATFEAVLGTKYTIVEYTA